MFLFSALAGQSLWRKWLLREGKEKSQCYATLGPLHLLEWRELEELCVLQKHALCTPGLHWPCLISPLTCFQRTVLQTLNLCNKEWFSEQAYAERPDRNALNIAVFTTRETFDPIVQVQQ